jgi:hypothetical protein
VRRLRLLTVLSTAFLLQAGVASALEDPGILEHMSGPGPFVRFPGVTYKVACFSRVGDKTYTSFMHPTDRGAALEWEHKEHPEPPRGNAQAEAHKKCADDKDVLGFVAVSYGHYFSLENNLFPHDLTDSAFTVKAESASVRFMGRTLQGVVDVGFGADIFWFHGDAFESFTRFALEPVRLSVAPFAALTDSPRARAFHLTVAPKILFGSLTQAGFCNTSKCSVTPREFATRAETLWTTTFEVDVVTLVSGK